MAKKEIEILTFEQYANNSNFRIIPTRLCSRRKELGMEQRTFVDKLNEIELQSSDHFRSLLSQSVCSMWESGRRPVSAKHNIYIAKVLNVSVAYLIGLTDDKEKEEIDKQKFSENTSSDHKEVISPNNLYLYDGMPIYVEFTNYAHVNGWGIYNKKKSIIIMPDIEISENGISKIANLYIYKDLCSPISYDAKNCIPFDSMMKYDTVYIEMNTSDDKIRYMYNGWYHHNELKTCLINDRGLTLPYDGLSKAFTAYSPKGRHQF